ncbi:MAG: DUF1937 family protein [Cypionkella sp.]
MSRTFDWGALMQDAARFQSNKIVFGKTPAYVGDVIGKGRFVYLATPYSKRVVDRMGKWSLGLSGKASAEASVQVGLLKDAGVSAFSPIVLSAEVVHATLNPFRVQAEPAPRHDPLDAKAWMDWCLPFLWCARAMVIPAIDGWDQSDGIKFEVMEAIAAGLPIIVYAEGGNLG